jgi:hypothetical protein
MYGFPMTMWLAVGWLLLAAGILTLFAFVLRLLWYSLAEFIAEHSALTAVASRGHRVRGDAG